LEDHGQALFDIVFFLPKTKVLLFLGKSVAENPGSMMGADGVAGMNVFIWADYK
jgi:hypothetical protein